MKLKEMKQAVLTLIEESNAESKWLTDDPDIEAKMNEVINLVMFLLARMKKIAAVQTVAVTNKIFDMKELERFFQLEKIRFTDSDGNEGDYDLFANFVEFSDTGTATFYYFKYPERITDDTDDEAYVFELSDDALHIMPYGVAGDLLKSDVSNSYGEIYSGKFETELARLDSRTNTGVITFEGGIEI